MKPTRLFLIAALIVLALLQYKLWLSPNGLSQYLKLKNQIVEVDKENTELQAKNAHVAAEVNNLKKGNEAVEERARNNLGLIKADETFYQIVQ